MHLTSWAQKFAFSLYFLESVTGALNLTVYCRVPRKRIFTERTLHANRQTLLISFVLLL